MPRQPQIRNLAERLGQLNGTEPASDNVAVSAYTAGDPGVDQPVQFATVEPLEIEVEGRFLAFSVNAAAANCDTAGTFPPQLHFFLVDGTDRIPATAEPIDPCEADDDIGTFTSDTGILFTGSQLGIEMTNATGSGIGNDAAFDDIRLLDVTPQLDKAFDPPQLRPGGVTTIVITVTNTAELAAKAGWSFTEQLSCRPRRRSPRTWPARRRAARCPAPAARPASLRSSVWPSCSSAGPPPGASATPRSGEAPPLDSVARGVGPPALDQHRWSPAALTTGSERTGPRPVGSSAVRVVGLHRYPVKSLQGEALTEAEVGRRGIVGDRAFALRDASTGVVLTGRRDPQLLFGTGRLDGEGGAAVTLPDGTTTTDDHLLSTWLGRPVHLVAASAARSTYETPIDPLDDASEVITWQGPAGTFHDSRRTQVSIVATGDLGDWDPRRFRANVVVEADTADHLVGQRVRLGTAVLDVVKQIDRCVMVTRAQPGLDRDLDVFKRIRDERGTCLAVGALVVTPGRVRVGDALEALGAPDRLTAAPGA